MNSRRLIPAVRMADNLRPWPGVAMSVPSGTILHPPCVGVHIPLGKPAGQQGFLELACTRSVIAARCPELARNRLGAMSALQPLSRGKRTHCGHIATATGRSQDRAAA